MEVKLGKISGKNPCRFGGYPRIVASQHDFGTVYVTQTGRRDDDAAVYVWRSKDFGNYLGGYFLQHSGRTGQCDPGRSQE